MMDTSHPADGDLRAYADLELSKRQTMQIRKHLAGCDDCRARLWEDRAAVSRVSAILSSIGLTSVAEAWARVAALRSRPQRRWESPVVVAIALLIVAFGAFATLRPAQSEHVSANGRRDVCCWNLDGGRGGDDGILTVSRVGEQVDCVVIYDDVDHSRSLTPGDLIRYVSDPVACGVRAGAVHAGASRLLRQLALK